MGKTRSLALSAMLIALALGLSYMERFLPLQLLIPLPGVKLGLANIVTLFALYFLGGKSAVQILVIRCALGAMFGGGLTAFFFSITGGVLAMATMALTRRLPFLSIYGVSICGAAAHQTGQVLSEIHKDVSCRIREYLLRFQPLGYPHRFIDLGRQHRRVKLRFRYN